MARWPFGRRLRRRPGPVPMPAAETATGAGPASPGRSWLRVPPIRPTVSWQAPVTIELTGEPTAARTSWLPRPAVPWPMPVWPDGPPGQPGRGLSVSPPAAGPDLAPRLILRAARAAQRPGLTRATPDLVGPAQAPAEPFIPAVALAELPRESGWEAGLPPALAAGAQPTGVIDPLGLLALGAAEIAPPPQEMAEPPRPAVLRRATLAESRRRGLGAPGARPGEPGEPGTDAARLGPEGAGDEPTGTGDPGNPAGLGDDQPGRSSQPSAPAADADTARPGGEFVAGQPASTDPASTDLASTEPTAEASQAGTVADRTDATAGAADPTARPADTTALPPPATWTTQPTTPTAASQSGRPRGGPPGTTAADSTSSSQADTTARSQSGQEQGGPASTTAPHPTSSSQADTTARPATRTAQPTAPVPTARSRTGLEPGTPATPPIDATSRFIPGQTRSTPLDPATGDPATAAELATGPAAPAAARLGGPRGTSAGESASALELDSEADPALPLAGAALPGSGAGLQRAPATALTSHLARPSLVYRDNPRAGPIPGRHRIVTRPVAGPERVPGAIAERMRQVHAIDVSHVVIDRGPAVSLRAHRMDARAFTEGGTVFLPAEAGDVAEPVTAALLGHELAHVAQQRELGSDLPGEDTEAGQELEAEARSVEQWLAGGPQPPPLRHRRPVAPGPATTTAAPPATVLTTTVTPAATSPPAPAAPPAEQAAGGVPAPDPAPGQPVVRWSPEQGFVFGPAAGTLGLPGERADEVQVVEAAALQELLHQAVASATEPEPAPAIDLAEQPTTGQQTTAHQTTAHQTAGPRQMAGTAGQPPASATAGYGGRPPAEQPLGPARGPTGQPTQASLTSTGPAPTGRTERTGPTGRTERTGQTERAGPTGQTERAGPTGPDAGAEPATVTRPAQAGPPALAAPEPHAGVAPLSPAASPTPGANAPEPPHRPAGPAIPAAAGPQPPAGTAPPLPPPAVAPGPGSTAPEPGPATAPASLLISPAPGATAAMPATIATLPPSVATLTPASAAPEPPTGTTYSSAIPPGPAAARAGPPAGTVPPPPATPSAPAPQWAPQPAAAGLGRPSPVRAANPPPRPAATAPAMPGPVPVAPPTRPAIPAAMLAGVLAQATVESPAGTAVVPIGAVADAVGRASARPVPPGPAVPVADIERVLASAAPLAPAPAGAPSPSARQRAPLGPGPAIEATTATRPWPVPQPPAPFAGGAGLAGESAEPVTKGELISLAELVTDLIRDEPPRHWVDMDNSEHLEQLTAKLYDRLSDRLRRDVLVQRERSGRLMDSW